MAWRAWSTFLSTGLWRRTLDDAHCSLTRSSGDRFLTGRAASANWKFAATMHNGETLSGQGPSKAKGTLPGGNESVSAAQSSEHLTQLLDRVRSGDEAALTQLLQQYEPRLRTAARVLLGPLLRPSMDSVDLVQ